MTYVYLDIVINLKFKIKVKAYLVIFFQYLIILINGNNILNKIYCNCKI